MDRYLKVIDTMPLWILGHDVIPYLEDSVHGDGWLVVVVVVERTRNN